ncbi:cytosol aminopeptidase [Actinobacillus succinogenes]|uniref:Probable cytosol aminopeptidase n=1 Tax=Actinobacillus succinogenes (strain ATCC 55618 / DSM 22257 / CCUG 43843 / 130Z) TaxID=339671 RepID=AMPA_ACTSZ|nr:leucyl aminopeptidase [Actinobacillus succinogenes]A6VMX3.1 RecName: Full=Probable cytosol aminopeptidase; AltName: Full=Leucine aminopeptidase; Short=LAP; AltName: Full=Leucyl aminopeptidase [Actinobacillus succinogenes 130Z]ABR74320.1 Leucyl aminopeptidase [Actinobacillus succinogenes 130Z]PHI39256.1 cytosol aminopeptidase [Actinobacillus succinogenes]
MKYSANLTALLQTDTVLVAVFEDGSLSPSAQQFDGQGEVSALLKSGDISGKIGEIATFRRQNQRIIVVGAGKPNDINERQFKQITQKAFQAVKPTSAQTLANALTEVQINGRDLYWNIRFGLETIAAESYIFDEFKSKKADPVKLRNVIFHADDKQAQLAVQHGSAIALGVKLARDIANCPPNVCNPNYLAAQAKKLEKQTALLTTAVLGEKEMAELGMHAYLGVSQGSKNEAQLSVMTYKNHPDPHAKPIVLVGKGLTFDAGGISLKPSADMDEMKYDMCGAASIFGVMNALVELQLPLNVIGVMAGCENLPDGNAYRPGDILTTMNGLTVEVLNTDAEGRLVLCDTLTYVERFEPECVVDVATLTGACVVALGQHNSGLISTNDELAEQLFRASQQTQDKAWRLPLSDEYQEQLKSPFADLANIGGRWGGAITAGAFLSNFTKQYRWAHLDIAGTAWLQGANKGATGRPVSLLTQFLINQCQ